MALHATRGTVIITGANGGMGRACARHLGATRQLVLTDISDSLNAFAHELEQDGYRVLAAITGDFESPAVQAALAKEAAKGNWSLIHACGLPPSAPWRQVMRINYVATVRLLDALGPLVQQDTAAVLIASVAGYLSPAAAEVEASLANPHSPGLLDDLEPLMRRMLGPSADRTLGTLSYALSKKAVMHLCEARAAAWGSKGGRIVSISPGMIWTPMGRAEAELDEAANAQVTMAPAGRWGTAAEIAAAAAFLIGPSARFISGCDLRMDGGAVGSLRASHNGAWIDMLRAR